MNRFVIADPQLCIGCGTCMAACSTAHKAEGLQTHPRLTVMRHKQATAACTYAVIVKMRRARKYVLSMPLPKNRVVLL